MPIQLHPTDAQQLTRVLVTFNTVCLRWYYLEEIAWLVQLRPAGCQEQHTALDFFHIRSFVCVPPSSKSQTPHVNCHCNHGCTSVLPFWKHAEGQEKLGWCLRPFVVRLKKFHESSQQFSCSSSFRRGQSQNRHFPAITPEEITSSWSQ